MNHNHREECNDPDCSHHSHDKKNHESHGHKGHLEKDNLNSFTLTGSYRLDSSLTQSTIKDRIGDVVSWLGEEAIDRGAPVIGHIKGWVEMQDKFRFSFVNVEEGVDLDGSVDPEVPVNEFSFKMLAVIPLSDSKLSSLRSEVDRKLKNISD
ncbi:hypothetical protein AMET1_1046 [Methanonatronarchaeum thermophilum]|uniref:Uncharacterized protein n=1 Tax=Methanonatronarchaeum thermophilum TaxID=1927129 RepID=A0A1Y3GD70_9EURY|nr:hypothetical protein [Methanonatronarchaeum thermophilum]OUJ18144.1 hypothetical protein AMET1_1046 [Methanonatronarchaeum thermophilum]